MNNQPRAIMIFAAGFGTRMGALTKDLPKPLITVGGRLLIDHALELARAIQPKVIVVNTHYHADQLKAHLAPLDVLLSYEPQILETGGGLRAALPLLGTGPVFTMNPDAIWQGPNPLDMLLKAWNPDLMDALLMCIPVAQAMGHTGTGDFDTDDMGRLQRGSSLVYGGAQILKTDGLRDIGKTAFSLNLLWDQINENNRLYCCNYPGKWCDVGHPEGIDMAESLLAKSDV
ncbi:MAG: nucleotidyltransferase family protein [Rhodobacteraceae bacterium]|nr:nucleotidyltransferase family protein [Paracoccaceae bacterium]